ncbi:hypothetical protein Cgig2_032084 [Carnegiea gigantea]|uniref:Formiminotransferase N-terminal subdomain domain-containing protein n=1 Tax=Carnegiea gigantea TaxID=171969 RepID=A0A9Q1JM14_9CARY|nr:hypothetical protein Cgig2_032084 [Carnegiea gigantea]
MQRRRVPNYPTPAPANQNIGQLIDIDSIEQEPEQNKKKPLDHSILICCKIYISESRNHTALDSVERVAKLNPETVIVTKFPDRVYNRVNFTFVSYVMHNSTGSPIYSPLMQTVVDMAEAASQAIYLEHQSGAHPCLGVDDILFNPLAQASLDEAAWPTRAVAKEIGNHITKFASTFLNLYATVPIFLYVAAYPTGKALDTIRRELGYFHPNFVGNQWAGWNCPETLAENPDEGPCQMPDQGAFV